MLGPMHDSRARLRTQILVAMGLAGCHSPQATDAGTPTQTVTLTPTPTATPTPSPTVAAVPSAIPAASASATVPEPNCGMCMIKCEPAGKTALVGAPLPAPYAMCARSIESGEGELSPARTDSARVRDPNTCCYVFPNVHPRLGRPLRVDGEMRVARTLARGDWAAPLSGLVLELDPGERTRRAREWLEAAQAEHASIASFARFALQLAAVGAPPDLLADAHHAALDEIEHARISYAIASAYAGEPLGPDRLPLGELGVAVDLATMARETFEDGCVAETVAALEASEKAAVETDEVLRQALLRIAEDEGRHAALAWQAVAWALRTGGDDVRSALVAAFAQVGRGDARIEECVAPCAVALLAA